MNKNKPLSEQTLDEMLHFGHGLADLRGKIQDNAERKTYANRIFFTTIGWLLVVIIILVFSGRGWLKFSDGVLISLITTTTINILSSLVLVVKYLFKQD